MPLFVPPKKTNGQDYLRLSIPFLNSLREQSDYSSPSIRILLPSAMTGYLLQKTDGADYDSLSSLQTHDQIPTRKKWPMSYSHMHHPEIKMLLLPYAPSRIAGKVDPSDPIGTITALLKPETVTSRRSGSSDLQPPLPKSSKNILTWG